jgi:hypothetical protein
MIVSFIMARMPIAAGFNTMLIDVDLTAQIVLQTIVVAIILLVILHF